MLGKRKTESSPLNQHSREGVDATSGGSNAFSVKKRNADDLDNDEEQDDGDEDDGNEHAKEKRGSRDDDHNYDTVRLAQRAVSSNSQNNNKHTSC